MVPRVFSLYESNCDPPYHRRTRQFIFTFTVLVKTAVQFPQNREETDRNLAEITSYSCQRLVLELLDMPIVDTVTVDHDSIYISLVDEKLWFHFELAVRQLIVENFCTHGGPEHIYFKGDPPKKYRKRWKKVSKRARSGK